MARRRSSRRNPLAGAIIIAPGRSRRSSRSSGRGANAIAKAVAGAVAKVLTRSRRTRTTSGGPGGNPEHGFWDGGGRFHRFNR